MQQAGQHRANQARTALHHRPRPALPCPAAAALLLADNSIPQLQCHCGGLAVTRTRHSFILGRPFRRLTGKKLLAPTRSSPPPVNNNGNLSDQPEPEPTNQPTCPISAGHPCHLGVSGESGFVSQGRDWRRCLLQWKSAASSLTTEPVAHISVLPSVATGRTRLEAACSERGGRARCRPALYLILCGQG